MPRRGTEVAQLAFPAKKKVKYLEEQPVAISPSLDISFCDDEALSPGIVFTDVNQKKWKIGKPIGRGSFGRIYLASDEIRTDVTKFNAQYVVKIEPYTNGPLFVEVHCLIRTAQAEKLKQWRQRHKQKRLGIPVYIASGSFTEKESGVKYRFLVLPRYDIDLEKIIARVKVLDLKNVLVLAIQILDVLEYLHDRGYTHSDIKSSNLMLGYDKSNKIDVPIVKVAPSFQNEINTDVDLSRKLKKSKPNKQKISNYYLDEDFIVKDYKNNSFTDDETQKKLALKNKFRNIYSDRDCRQLHRNHAFNLRQLTHHANYEDLNSSVCSDQSYQKLLDDFGNKNAIKTTKEFQQSKAKNLRIKPEPDVCVSDIPKEAIQSQSQGQIYLLDYGLASKFIDSDGNHKDFGMDLRKAHDGTLEYSSRDSHIGAHSRRSDLETLGYNMLDWLTGTLPWKTPEVLAEPDLVHALKKNFMSDIKLLLKTCFKTEFYPEFLEKYLQYITSLEFTEKPDYDYCRNLFKSELCKNGNKEITLNLKESTMAPIKRNKLSYSKRFGRKNTPPNFLALNGIRKSYERENVCSLENDLKLELLRQTLNTSSEGIRKPCVSRNFFISDADLVARLKKSLMPHGVFGKKLSPKNLRSARKPVQKRKNVKRHRNSIGKFGNFMGSARQFTWAEILAQNPEDIIRKERNAGYDESDDEDTCKYRIRKLSSASSDSDNVQSPLLQKDYLENLNPTYAMKEVINSMRNKLTGKNNESKDSEALEGYTPAMMQVYKMKKKQEAKEKAEVSKANAPKKEIKTARTTRSACKSTAKVEPSSIVTRQKARKESIEAAEKETISVNRQKARKSTEVEEDLKPKNNRRAKSCHNKKDDKKNVEIEVKETLVTKTRKATKKSSPKQTATVANRMRLRSTKRNK